jgi:hypothetical protein
VNEPSSGGMSSRGITGGSDARSRQVSGEVESRSTTLDHLLPTG